MLKLIKKRVLKNPLQNQSMRLMKNGKYSERNNRQLWKKTGLHIHLLHKTYDITWQNHSPVTKLEYKIKQNLKSMF